MRKKWWKIRARSAEAGERQLARQLRQFEDGRDPLGAQQLRDRLKRTGQAICAEIGSNGPETALESALRIPGFLESMRQRHAAEIENLAGAAEELSEIEVILDTPAGTTLVARAKAVITDRNLAIEGRALACKERDSAQLAADALREELRKAKAQAVQEIDNLKEKNDRLAQDLDRSEASLAEATKASNLVDGLREELDRAKASISGLGRVKFELEQLGEVIKEANGTDDIAAELSHATKRTRSIGLIVKDIIGGGNGNIDLDT